MFFSVEYMVKNLDIDLNIGDNIEIPFGGEKNISVNFRYTDKLKGCNCTISSHFDPTPIIEDVFNCIIERKVPHKVDKNKWTWTLDEDGNVNPKHLQQLNCFPVHFQSFIKEVNDEMLNVAKQIVFLLRWMNGVEGEHNPFQLIQDIGWSFDCTKWHRVPPIYFFNKINFRKITVDIQKITELVKQGIEEPLYHNLHREACDVLNQNGNLRSALILGITALEVGVKQLVVDLVPDSKWLVENLPSPPITNIIKNYIPNLLKSRVATYKVSIPNDLIKKIEDAVTNRNKVVHGRDYKLEWDYISEILELVKNLLWTFDYYRGCDWALNHLSQDYKEKLNII